MQKIRNLLLGDPFDKPIVTDVFFREGAARPVIIYAHGFNGFKDWGNFDLVAEQFATAGFAFVKFNFSHNGTTPAMPDMFTDLEAYSENNYTRELNDLQQVINWVCDEDQPYAGSFDRSLIYLIGHSRGGGIVIITAAEDPRIKAIATWASVAECKTPWGNWTTERLEQWRETGIDYYLNARTRQELPLRYQLYEDYAGNKDRLDILNAMQRLRIPVLICHGKQDEAVPVEKAMLLHSAKPDASLLLLESDHVFGRKHPWQESHLPVAMQTVVDNTIAFFQQH